MLAQHGWLTLTGPYHDTQTLMAYWSTTSAFASRVETTEPQPAELTHVMSPAHTSTLPTALALYMLEHTHYVTTTGVD